MLPKRTFAFQQAFFFLFYFYFLALMNNNKYRSCTMQETNFTIHGTQNHFIQKKKKIKMGSTVLFTYLKIILLQCFSVFSFQLYPNGPLCQRIKMSNDIFAFMIVIFFQNFLNIIRLLKINSITCFCNFHAQNKISLTKIFHIKMAFKHIFCLIYNMHIWAKNQHIIYIEANNNM